MPVAIPREVVLFPSSAMMGFAIPNAAPARSVYVIDSGTLRLGNMEVRCCCTR
jgi:hypothetical protein